MRDELTGSDPPGPLLWVRLAAGWTPDPDLRWRIAGSALGHRGHFHVCSPTGDQHRTVNLGDVVETSPEAAIWLDGFLQGQQASLWEYLGQDETLVSAADEADERRQLQWNQRFRQRGFAAPLAMLPARDTRLSAFAAPRPWCYVGGLYRVWIDTDWYVANPQPDPVDSDKRWIGWGWPGSSCVSLREHDMDERSGIFLCMRCHHVER